MKVFVIKLNASDGFPIHCPFNIQLLIVIVDLLNGMMLNYAIIQPPITI